ncbi:uncharacterized protein PAN0_003d1986 [Moesziomyces antarcticus]|uniref:Secreted protein n=1 Tax=Pseudozyma antarctica TaxID=84753 RepID=A0A5C3FLL7_PSEA2|nr:uncharacterized protein PAN0_003d1986 [Moesziomyces antarcticus]GAK63778.1 hypothetical protein PAN0_003d1986 [Moesziomyces antarcticus]SPO44381.1 uncharacterized protein PSANT_02066 [Moesziomyces antarcticus]
MLFRTASLVAFTVFCLARTGSCDSDTDDGFQKPSDEVSTEGLKVDSNQVMAYCFWNKPTENVPFACFTLKGDIRQRMRSPQNLKGYISPGGETFVVLAQAGGQSFTTEVNRVTIQSYDAQPNCLLIGVEEQPQGGDGEFGLTRHSGRDRVVCPGQSATHLDDAP